MAECYVENCENEDDGVDGKCLFHSEDEIDDAADFFDHLLSMDGVSPAIVEVTEDDNDAPD